MSLYVLRLACIFLAGKTEENFIQIKDLQLISNKYTEEQILNAEKVLLDVRVLPTLHIADF